MKSTSDQKSREPVPLTVRFLYSMCSGTQLCTPRKSLAYFFYSVRAVCACVRRIVGAPLPPNGAIRGGNNVPSPNEEPLFIIKYKKNGGMAHSHISQLCAQRLETS